MNSCSSVEEALTESSTGTRDELQYNSDIFDYTFSESVTVTVSDHKLDGSHISTHPSPPSLHLSPLEAGSTDINGRLLSGAQCEPEKAGDSSNEEDRQTAAEHQVDAEVFAKKKLEVLKLSAANANRNSTDELIKYGSSDIEKEYDAEEIAFIEAGLARLRGRQEEERCSVKIGSESRNKQKRDDAVFVRQCEKLKIKSLKHSMKTDIKRLDEETREHHHTVQCCALQREMSEKKFVNHKLKSLTEPVFQQKLDRHLHERDPLTLLGEIVKTNIRPSAPSDDVWRAMTDKVQLLKLKPQTHQDQH